VSAHAYTEDQLVEQPAIGLFAELGWQTVVAMDESFGADGRLGREASGEVVLVSRLRAALTRLNASRMGHHALPPEAITAAVNKLICRLSSLHWLSGMVNLKPN
jgi:type I restriction enzyme R subunit